MSEKLFLLAGDRSLKTMAISPFESEDAFQDLLAKFPELLANAEFSESAARRWILVVREADIPDKDGGSARWSVDHLFLDQDGVPTLVEVKRATDTRARREVVAQMLDYASHAVSYWKSDELAVAFEKTCKKSNVDSLVELNKLLGEAANVEAFWQGVQANLSSGRIRMIFVADLASQELERIVEFLNEQMKPATVLALELRSFSNGEDRILSPRLIGATARANARKLASPPAYSSADDWATATSDPAATRKFLDEMRTLGATATLASSKAVAIEVGVAALRALYVRDGRIGLALYQLKKSEAFSSETARTQLISKCEALGLNLSSHNQDGEPSFPLPKMEDAKRWAAIQISLPKCSRK